MFQKEKALPVRIIKIKGKNEKCGLQYQNTGTLASSNGHRVVQEKLNHS